MLYAKNPRLQSFPASLTKLMTIYLIFEALESNQLALSEQLKVSAAAARTSPVRLGLKKGQKITLRKALQAMIVKSANDAAVVAAERIAGSEPAFANLMNARAEALGMSDSVFYNASGLPHPRQVTTARDMAILARVLMTEFPGYISLFSKNTFQVHNKRLGADPNSNSAAGIQGLKTGFTCQAGYNLIASAEKDGRRLIGVILGERNPRSRNSRMATMLKQASGQEKVTAKELTISDLEIDVSQNLSLTVNKKVIADSCAVGSKSRAPAFARASGWGLVLGVRKDENEALALSRQTKRNYSSALRSGRPHSIPFLRGVLLNRASITNLSQDRATAACKLLRNRGQYCVVINPKVVRMYVEKGHLALDKAVAF